MIWKPISAVELEALIDADLAACTPEEVDWFTAVRVPLRAVPIRRGDDVEQVFVVAEHAGTVIYYEDVEGGFNLSPLDAEGSIASPSYEQWALRHAIVRLFA